MVPVVILFDRLNNFFDRIVPPYYNVSMWDAVKKILVEMVTVFRSELCSDSGERPDAGEVPTLIAEGAVFRPCVACPQPWQMTPGVRHVALVSPFPVGTAF